MTLYQQHATAFRIWQHKFHELLHFDLQLKGGLTTPAHLARKDKLRQEVAILRDRLRELAHLLG